MTLLSNFLGLGGPESLDNRIHVNLIDITQLYGIHYVLLLRIAAIVPTKGIFTGPLWIVEWF